MPLSQDRTPILDRWLKELKRLPVFCAPLALILVACLQLYRVHADHLVPWKGGGFGMFASVDMPAARFLRCYLITAQGETPLPIPEKLSPLAEEVRFIPNPERLAHLASRLAQAAAKIEARQVRVEVWRYSFDAAYRQLKAHKITAITVGRE